MYINPFNKNKNTTMWTIVNCLFLLKRKNETHDYNHRIIETLRLLVDLLENEMNCSRIDSQ